MRPEQRNPMLHPLSSSSASVEWARQIEALGYRGMLIKCSATEYHSGLRTAIQAAAGKWIDQKQDIRARLALAEVRRLDEKFGAEDKGG